MKNSEIFSTHHRVKIVIENSATKHPLKNFPLFLDHIMASEVEAVPVPDEEVATGPDGEPDRKTSVGSGEIQLSKIQVGPLRYFTDFTAAGL